VPISVQNIMGKSVFLNTDNDVPRQFLLISVQFLSDFTELFYRQIIVQKDLVFRGI